MPAPEFVVANSAYTTYPGGVIALRCSDWMAGARGTLSSGADARTVSGTAVVDEQGISGELFSAAGRQAMHEAADDTLVIDLAQLPIEVGFRYYMLVSYLVEGNWNPSVVNTFRGRSQFNLLGSAALSWWGDAATPAETSPYAALISIVPRLMESFVIGQLGTLRADDGDEVIHIRAYGDSDSTVVWNLDQLYLVPRVFGFMGDVNGWESADFQMTGPNSGFSVPETSDGLPEDGDDGGDDNGKFTRAPFPLGDHELLDPMGDAGGGDYQQKASAAAAEYMTRILPDDFWYLARPDGSEATAHAYSAHGPYWRRGNIWAQDDFDRTLGPDDWGATPEGFGWWVDNDGMTQNEGDVTFAVDGDEGVWEMFYDRTNSYETGSINAGLHGADGTGITLGTRAHIAAGENIIFSGQFRMEERAGTVWLDDGHLHGQQAVVSAGLYYGQLGTTNALPYGIHVRRKATPTTPGGAAVDKYEWWLVAPWQPAQPVTGTILHGPVDISSWFDWGAEVGFKIEVRRYLLRVKVWDASGAEPAGWDYEEFRPLLQLSGSTPTPYPYTGMTLSQVYNRANRSFTPHIGAIINAQGGNGGGMNVYWSSIAVGNDHLDTEPGSMFVNVEQPDQGAEVGEIELPWGPWQLIYWGARDWTSPETGFPDPGFNSYLDFASKVWVEEGASDIELAASLFYYFRTLHGGVVSMNWRSGQRPATATRVHVGS